MITTAFEGGSWQRRWIPIDSETPVTKPGQTITAVWANASHLDLFLTGREGRVISTFLEGSSWQPDWFAIFPDANLLRDERNVTTELYNNERTGANLHESKLTPSLVRSGKFKRLVRWQVEGQVLAQPLYVRDVPIGPPTDQKTKNLVIVATAANLLYAFDADNLDANAQPVFAVNLGAVDRVPPRCGQTSPPVVGVTSTPVIDQATGILYVVNFDTKLGEHLIHALDFKHQFVEIGKPVVIESPPGFDHKFDPASHRNRPSLLLMNEVVYVGFASFLCDAPRPFGGWVFGYKASTLERVAFWRNSVHLGGGSGNPGVGSSAGPIAQSISKRATMASSLAPTAPWPTVSSSCARHARLRVSRPRTSQSRTHSHPKIAASSQSGTPILVLQDRSCYLAGGWSGEAKRVGFMCWTRVTSH